MLRPFLLPFLLFSLDLSAQHLQTANGALPPDAAEQVEIDVKYRGYVDRAERRADLARSMEAVALPDDVDWSVLHGLSTEVRERLHRSRPPTLGHLERIPGITPAAVAVVAGWLARRQLDASV